jgi:hypothetical protein
MTVVVAVTASRLAYLRIHTIQETNPTFLMNSYQEEDSKESDVQSHLYL